MSKRALIEEIRWELSQLRRLATVAAELAALPEAQRDPWDTAAAAKYAADVFNGLENLWKRRCTHLKEPWPEGPDSHARILNDFLSNSSLGARLSPEIAERLRLYKSFRHRFIHGYAFEPLWETVETPLRLIPETVAALESVWERWISELSDDLGQ
ncbi:MAG: hypothetical protein HY706_21540 [Candidatus Hydrogenedentes bacterium]|nr:hypothetical protein [Candidatus Hydrogenedentota bacterium]